MYNEIFNKPEFKNRRQSLRNDMSEPEKELWYYLRNSQFLDMKFRRQQSVGKYILDFYSPSLKLCIEIDGNDHAEKYKYDDIRTKFLNEKGITVIRYWNNEITQNISGVLTDLEAKVTTLNPSLKRRENKL